ncbi:hypothetical protein N7462_002384 [Penicillium macrosclerotiorum]|uniref:uncharacterized protein n=1 Tax=Penicillium macrosclerotiorum TaxID=303699 RepID=UPI002546E857|nr:uncharacterized protein N7462_002384 [Penicillium macrosclerotiorum]KAJ5692961.1 hypothetical protein N7462_002384 [Penicillium macrosclerotiorum]
MPEPRAGVDSVSSIKVSIVLNPLASGDSLTRNISLSSSNPSVEIGRSSKRGNKNRSPAEDNGWFDSRVMSRFHADLGISLEKRVTLPLLRTPSYPKDYAERAIIQSVYICDNGSTHGTWLNNVKLSTGEKTPLISGDELRFGVNVDRGDEEFPALSVQCEVEWLASDEKAEESGDVYVPADIQEVLDISHAEHFPKFPATDPNCIIQASTSTNTFCVPEDDDSDIEEIPATKFNGHKEGSRLQGTFLADYSDGEISESNEEDSDLDSNPSSFSETSERVSYTELLCVESRSDDDSTSEYAEENEFLLGQEDNEFINPTILNNSDEPDSPALAGAALRTFSHENDMTGKSCIKVESPEVNEVLRTPFPQVPIPSALPTWVEKRAEEEESRRLGRLSISDVLNPYQDGPFACSAMPGSNDASVKKPVESQVESVQEPDMRSKCVSLKRKASEIELQDAQIPDVALSQSEMPDFESVTKSKVADAISSALSENTSHVPSPPTKRIKTSHASNIASYTATAVISALLGGLGTIALLAALPAEYFQ